MTDQQQPDAATILQVQAYLEQQRLQQIHAHQVANQQKIAAATAVSNMAGLGCMLMILLSVLLIAFVILAVCFGSLIKDSPGIGWPLVVGLISLGLLGVSKVLKMLGK